MTFRVRDMRASVNFYRDVLGMELLYGGEEAGFSSLRTKDDQSAILNLEEGDTATGWGWLILHYTKHRDLLEQIAHEIEPGSEVPLGDGTKATLVDQFAEKMTVFRPLGVSRYEIEVENV